MKSLKISFISAYEAIETCHYPVYVIRLQKEGQIPAKLSFARNGSETLKMVETIWLKLVFKSNENVQFRNISKPLHLPLA